MREGGRGGGWEGGSVREGEKEDGREGGREGGSARRREGGIVREGEEGGGLEGRVTERMRLIYILTNLLSLVNSSGEMTIICESYFITYESSMSLLHNRQK